LRYPGVVPEVYGNATRPAGCPGTTCSASARLRASLREGWLSPGASLRTWTSEAGRFSSRRLRRTYHPGDWSIPRRPPSLSIGKVGPARSYLTSHPCGPAHPRRLQRRAGAPLRRQHATRDPQQRRQRLARDLVRFPPCDRKRLGGGIIRNRDWRPPAGIREHRLVVFTEDRLQAVALGRIAQVPTHYNTNGRTRPVSYTARRSGRVANSLRPGPRKGRESRFAAVWWRGRASLHPPPPRCATCRRERGIRSCRAGCGAS